MNNSWKDLFAFSRKEQAGIAVLLAVLLLLIGLNPLIPKLFKVPEADMDDFRQQAEAFMDEMAHLDSIEHSSIRPDKTHFESSGILAFHGQPFFFDPNTISRDSLLLTGTPEFVINNILNYRKKGGRFKKPEDLKKIYGMKPEWYAELGPYIRIKADDESRVKREKSMSGQKADQAAQEEMITLDAEIFIEINTADSAALTMCTGIGPSFARRIIAYRELLGGYHTTLQLMEVSGMDSARFALFAHQVWADPGAIRKMDINNLVFKDMLKHPYFDYYLVKAIFSYRDSKKILDSIGELRQLPEVYPELYDKISPYLVAGHKD